MGVAQTSHGDRTATSQRHCDLRVRAAFHRRAACRPIRQHMLPGLTLALEAATVRPLEVAAVSRPASPSAATILATLPHCTGKWNLRSPPAMSARLMGALMRAATASRSESTLTRAGCAPRYQAARHSSPGTSCRCCHLLLAATMAFRWCVCMLPTALR